MQTDGIDPAEIGNSCMEEGQTYLKKALYMVKSRMFETGNLFIRNHYEYKARFGRMNEG